MKTAECKEARRLRREEGRSVKELAALLGVSRSSISRWVRDIELTEDQRRTLRNRMGGRLDGARINTLRARERHRRAQAAGRAAARRGDVAHLAGCMLYWAEGSRDHNTLTFTNSDPAMVAFFVGFLRRCFGIADETFAVTCNLFADHEGRRREIENFWVQRLALTRSNLRRATVNHYSRYSQKKRRNKLPYGTCRVSVHDTHLVQHIHGAIQEYGDFEREEWLM